MEYEYLISHLVGFLPCRLAYGPRIETMEPGNPDGLHTTGLGGHGRAFVSVFVSCLVLALTVAQKAHRYGSSFLLSSLGVRRFAHLVSPC